MNLDDLKASLAQGGSPPPGLPPTLQSLWWDALGNWDKAHELVQDLGSADAAWVHAYLHRKEGDAGNARYWYDRAGREVFRKSLEDEWAAIAEELLGAP